MATVNQTGLPTLLDQVKRTDPNGSIAPIVELLTQDNEILQHAVWSEGNLVTGHRFTSRTGLPSVGWRKLNEGVSPGKSSTDQIDEACGILSGMSAVDVEVAKLGGNEAAFRASEDAAFLQSFNNEFARALIYESTKANPERMHGIQPRLNQLPGGTAMGASQVIDAGGGNNDGLTSMYLICWSPEAVFCIYPKGSTGGLEQQDMGVQLWDDGTGKKFRAYVTQWTWKVGLVIKDYRQVARIANINTNTAGINKGATGTAGYLFDHMLKAHYQIKRPSAGRMAWYANRVIAHWLHAQALEKSAPATLTVDTVDGKPVTRYLGVPIYVIDVIKGYPGGTRAAGTSETQVTTTT